MLVVTRTAEQKSIQGTALVPRPYILFEAGYIFPVQFELTVFNYIKAVMEVLLFSLFKALPLVSTGHVSTLKGQDAPRIPT